jgi:hypothetical protein
MRSSRIYVCWMWQPVDPLFVVAFQSGNEGKRKICCLKMLILLRFLIFLY